MVIGLDKCKLEIIGLDTTPMSTIITFSTFPPEIDCLHSVLCDTFLCYSVSFLTHVVLLSEFQELYLQLINTAIEQLGCQVSLTIIPLFM